MKKILFSLLLVVSVNYLSHAQTGISAAGTAPDAAAMLDVIATDKGFMVPRVALTALNAAGPVTGLSATSTSLLVYNTATAGTAPNDVTPGFYYWNNATTSWVRILSGTLPTTGWALTGNAGTVDGTNFIGTTDNVPFNIRVNNQKAGRIEADVATGRTFFGYQSGNATPGNANSGFGYATLKNTTGANNTAMGYETMVNNTSGISNTAIGFWALNDNTVGSQNLALGSDAMQTNVAGNNGTAVGTYAMFYANSTATSFINSNSAFGFQALMGSTTASANTGNSNTALGYQTLKDYTTGANNTAVGYLAGVTTTGANTLTTGSNNTFIGYNTGFASATQRSNAAAIGYNAKVDASNAMVLGGTGADAVNVGIATTAPAARLVVNGALATTPATAVAAGATITIPVNTSAIRITDEGASAANAASVASATEGQRLTIYNNDAQAVSFAGTSVAATSGTAEYQYLNGGWRMLSNSSGTAVAGNDIDFATSSANSIDIEPTLNFVHTINAPAANNLNLIPPAGFKVTVNNQNPGTTGVNEVFSVYNGAGGASPTLYLTPSGRAVANDWYYSQGNTGWFNAAWGGGWYMDDNTAIKSYGSKDVRLVDNATTLVVDGLTTGGTYNAAAGANANLMYVNNSTGRVYSMPAANNSVLTTNGSGVPSWTSPSSLGVKWNAITAPDGDLTLAHGANSTTFSFNGTTVGSAWNMSSNTVTTGRLADLSISGAATSGGVLNLTGNNTTPANFVGTVLYATTAGTAPSNGYAYFNFTGNHTGHGLLVRDVTTAGNASAIIANSITSGSGLNVSSTATGLTTGSLINATLSGSNAANTGTVLKATNSGVLNVGTTLMVTNAGAATSTSFRVNDDGTDTDASPFIIDATGNVGVGTSAAGAKLSVSSNGTVLGGTAMSTTFKTQAGALGGTATNEIVAGSIGYTANTNQVALGVRGYRVSAGSDWTTTAIILGMDVDATPRAGGYISIGANGVIGIGVVPTSNTYKLNVQGGKLLTAGIDENSDARLKHNINPIYDALSKVTRMRGVTYNWRTEEFPERNFEKDLQFGLIAQELEKVVPELVTTDGDGYKAIEYTHLVPLLIEAIKELEAKNNTQQAVIDNQQKTNSELKASLENLLTRMNALENNVEVKTNKAEK
ncbi:MAG: tail fiber domain-containing protein [Bacteroidia bacterium]